MLLETCSAFNKLWNNKFYYKVVSCWLFLLIYSEESWHLSSVLCHTVLPCATLSIPHTFSSVKFCFWTSAVMFFSTSKQVLLPLHRIITLHYLLVSADHRNKCHIYLNREYVSSLTGRDAVPGAGSHIRSRGGWRG